MTATHDAGPMLSAPVAVVRCEQAEMWEVTA